MKKMIFSLLMIASALAVKAQEGKRTVYSPDSAISFEVVQYTVTDTKAGFKVKTDYSCVFSKLQDKFPDDIKMIVAEYKKDRGGKFRRYTIYFDAGVKPAVMSCLKEL